MVLCNIIPGKNKAGLSKRSFWDEPLGIFPVNANRLFEDFFGGLDVFTGDFSPRLDVNENEKEVKVVCELPGLDEKDITLSLTDGVLVIEGEKKEETDEKSNGYRHVERSYGSFKRSVRLGSEIDSEKSTAKFEKGVLSVVLPKIPQAEPDVKHIPIK